MKYLITRRYFTGDDRPALWLDHVGDNFKAYLESLGLAPNEIRFMPTAVDPTINWVTVQAEISRLPLHVQEMWTRLEDD